MGGVATYSKRKGRTLKAKPLTIGLFDEAKRDQIDIKDWLARKEV